MNNVMTKRADFDEVSWALSDIRKKHFKRAESMGMSFIDFLRSQKHMDALKAEMDKACILMGWTHELHQKMDHDQIMKQMQEAR
jgi:hypothetical protein